MCLVTTPTWRGGKPILFQVVFGVMADLERSLHKAVSDSMYWLLFLRNATDPNSGLDHKDRTGHRILDQR